MNAAIQKTDVLETAILEALSASEKPVSQRAISKALREADSGVRETALLTKLRDMTARGVLSVQTGPNRARLYWPMGWELPLPADSPRALEPIPYSETPSSEAPESRLARIATPESLRTQLSANEPQSLTWQGPEVLANAPIPGDPFSIAEAPEAEPLAVIESVTAKVFEPDEIPPEYTSEAW
jgi:hypothetical protein